MLIKIITNNNNNNKTLLNSILLSTSKSKNLLIIPIVTKNHLKALSTITKNSIKKYEQINRQKNFYTFTIRLKHNDETSEDKRTSIIERAAQDEISTHVTGARRVKQAAKDVSYGFIILAGGALLIGIFYFLFAELFSHESPSGIYDESSKLCKNDFNVQDAIGHPIKVTAESGGRRVFQIKHKYLVEDGHLYMILNYYLEGPKNKGTVYVKVKKNEQTGKFEYEHIIVKLDYLHRGERNIVVKHDQNK